MKNLGKLIAIIFVIIVVANFFLLFLGKITALFFWITLGLAALVAFKLLPKLRQQP